MKFCLSNTFVIACVFSGILGCGGTSPAPESEGGQVSLASTPELKAAMELGYAQTFEKSRKTKQAGEAYRRIIEKYPDSAQAKIAAERLKSLGSSPASR